MPSNRDRFFLDDLSGIAFPGDPRTTGKRRQGARPPRPSSPLARLSEAIAKLRERGRDDLAAKLIEAHGKREDGR